MFYTNHEEVLLKKRVKVKMLIFIAKKVKTFTFKHSFKIFYVQNENKNILYFFIFKVTYLFWLRFFFLQLLIILFKLYLPLFFKFAFLGGVGVKN